jgi:hypothetical protein
MKSPAPLQKGPCYPNGFKKSRLLNVYLKPGDLRGSLADRPFDLEFTRAQEHEGVAICEWRLDVDGLTVVEGLDLAETTSRVLVMPNGFKVQRKVQIFISYGREDARAAKRLTSALEAYGYLIWLDSDEIAGGELWERSIHTSIRECSRFIALLSSSSVRREGFVHSEVKAALRRQRNFPETRIFVIPVRLDSCDPTYEELMPLQRVDLFPDWAKGVDDLVRALEKSFIPEMSHDRL